ncbi:MAG: 5-formyltetrahydrofolate cyclo-ligase, partial [Salibacteraceae bacterium]
YFRSMGDEIVKNKKRIRKEMSILRNEVSAEQKKIFDKSICKQLRRLAIERNVNVVHSYLPMGSEVNVLPLIQEFLESGIQVVCPKTLPNRILENRVLKSLDDLEEGIMHTFHPKAPDLYTGQYDLIIVPGLAFDERKYRVGYGGGYYDGFLSEHNEALKAGVFYPFQKVDQVPTESHDLALDVILTP